MIRTQLWRTVDRSTADLTADIRAFFKHNKCLKSANETLAAAKLLSQKTQQNQCSELPSLVDFNGAPERNNLEYFDCTAVLEELENWTDILKAEPEVLERLATFENNLTEEVCDDQSARVDTATPEPSP